MYVLFLQHLQQDFINFPRLLSSETLFEVSILILIQLEPGSHK